MSAYSVSIHAARVGSDLGAILLDNAAHLVSIHAARVGSDAMKGQMATTLEVSIHAARVGSDQTDEKKTYSGHEFQSTLPVWAAT